MNLIPSTAAGWHELLLIATFIVCPVVFAILMLKPAAYGRHAGGHSKWWGPGIPTRLSWMIMEAPSSVGFAIIFFMGDNAFAPVPLILLLMWQSHYFDRTFVFPFRLRIKPGDRTPLGIPLSAQPTNLVISYLNATILSWTAISRGYELSWLWDPRFIVGALVFALGYWINRKADTMLANLRKPGETGYKIPRGWLYEKITCPNYFGELLIWTGWSIATWSLAGVAFIVLTLSNLVPRAIANHRWYQEKFDDYPPERKILIPHVF